MNIDITDVLQEELRLGRLLDEWPTVVDRNQEPVLFCLVEPGPLAPRTPEKKPVFDEDRPVLLSPEIPELMIDKNMNHEKWEQEGQEEEEAPEGKYEFIVSCTDADGVYYHRHTVLPLRDGLPSAEAIKDAEAATVAEVWSFLRQDVEHTV